MVDMRARIVVGLDGSRNSLLAVNWALAAACMRDRVDVVLCHVEPGPLEASHSQDDTRLTAAKGLLAGGLRHASRQAPTVHVSAELMVGHVTQRLLEAASGATMLVVGARGEGGFAGLRLGSISAQVARHAQCTVLVVPDLGDLARGRQDREIVVGVDGSADSSAALDFAFAEASHRQASVRAIHAFDASTLQLISDLPRSELIRLRVNAANTLRGLVDAHPDRGPDTEVCCEVLAGAAASTLVSAAANAELLVLGARGHGDAATMKLGSTSDTVLRHAPCPVAVVRGGQDPRPAGGHRRSRGALVGDLGPAAP